eukprot:GSMAST32.ASY1.ANO1.620.1 assembled CDS
MHSNKKPWLAFQRIFRRFQSTSPLKLQVRHTRNKTEKNAINKHFFKVALVGRPNVGKSTLYNRLVGGRPAICHREPGTTRDRQEGTAWLAGLQFTVVDTGGLEEGGEETMEGKITRATELAIEECDVAILMLDARAGVTSLDEHFVRWIRKRSDKTPMHMVLNKTEDGWIEPEDSLAISAEHGTGMVDLWHLLYPHSKITSEMVKSDEKFDLSSSSIEISNNLNNLNMNVTLNDQDDELHDDYNFEEFESQNKNNANFEEF